MSVWMIMLLMSPFVQSDITIEPLPAIQEVSTENTETKIQTHQIGSTIYVETYVPEVTFNRHDEERPKGYFIVTLDGEKEKVEQAAFMLKDVPSGKHQLVIELYDEKGSLLHEYEETIQL
ncbi:MULTISPECIES: hypothetical protein [unclassified Geomicrobium]|uniref:hypothetical protein n=1 Tax=unclassified Geomicrobium TaxID=2628951 RepID=UPI00045ECE39|nr:MULTISPECIES: hypothetical protein [unclassified Geomicrobium]GAJ99675.1 hypothetical protein JCM19055_2700 [Geomicrobium sp. JCM 19055]GAK07395.1 hypothetical protein JCM19038_1128 [Geomicrobium sp. JCM 19038]